jgi:hypothetical protein
MSTLESSITCNNMVVIMLIPTRRRLQDRLVLHCDLSFDALVSVVTDQEGLYQAVLAEEEKMRKRALSGPSEDNTEGAPPKYRLFTLHQLASHELHLHHHSGIITHLSRSSNRCYPRHLSSYLSLYHLVHLSRRLQ